MPATLARRMLACFILSISTITGAAPRPQVDPRTVRLPMVDGEGIRFTRITTADGLSQTRVAQIVQDDQGFMWFGTEYGLNRYDGYKFKLFVHDPQRPNSLGGTFISALFKGRSGMLWIGSNPKHARPVFEQRGDKSAREAIRPLGIVHKQLEFVTVVPI